MTTEAENNLLKATLREILRLKKVAATSDTAVNFDDIFDDSTDNRWWQSIMRKAEILAK